MVCLSLVKYLTCCNAQFLDEHLLVIDMAIIDYKVRICISIPSPFILLVRLGVIPHLAYPKDLFLGHFSTFCLLQILALFSHLALSQVIRMPMTFNPINIAQHLMRLLQSELCPRPRTLSMPGCHLIACC